MRTVLKDRSSTDDRHAGQTNRRAWMHQSFCCEGRPVTQKGQLLRLSQLSHPCYGSVNENASGQQRCLLRRLPEREVSFP